MKGVIVIALKEMVVKNFGESIWNDVLLKAGITLEPMLMITSNVDEQVVLRIISSLCELLEITLEQAAEAFGDYWVNVYSQRIYGTFYRTAKTSKDFLLKLDSVHIAMTKDIDDANPPRFEYEWTDGKTLIMKYKSERGLIDIAIGLIKGVGKYYKENLKINKLGNDKVEIVFP